MGRVEFYEKGGPRLSDIAAEAFLEVTVANREGVHARPVMRFVDVACTFRSQVWVRNVTRDGERVDGKSAMQMMLLEATQGCVLRIETRGPDAREAAATLAALVEAGFDTDSVCESQ